MAGVQTGNGNTGVLRSSWRHTAISANGTTVVSAAGGVTLHAIVINTSGVTLNTITVYDAASAIGTPIATIDGTTDEKTLFYDSDMLIGITVVVASGTAANLTVLWA